VSARRIAITGASGLIGGALSAFLSARGDDVLHLVRRETRTAAEITWDPLHRTLDPASLEGMDAVVHLAGAGVADKRWTPAYKQLILSSRADGTATVAKAVASHGTSIRLISGSAVGFYGSDRGDELLTDESPGGQGFLADVAMSRTGLVMAQGAGAFGPLVTLGRLGLAGPLGSGQQYWPWISLDDTVRALVHLVDHRDITGPVNVVGPEALPQREVVREIGSQLGRPTLLPAPAFALRAVLGEFATEVLGSQRVRAAVLEQTGFTYRHGTLSEAVATIV